MNFVSIPLAVLEAPEYLALTVADRQFLLDLYVVFHDTERFTIDMSKPADYRQPTGASLARKISRLMDAALLQVVGSRKTGPSHYQRVFAFQHPTHALSMETV